VEYRHESIMPEEAINFLKIKPCGTYIDATLGGGGHSLRVCQQLGPEGTLVAIDRDLDAVHRGMRVLAGYEQAIIVKENFAEIQNILNALGLRQVDGFLLDLGVSSYQLDEPSRGFSYMHGGPLDMRMDRQTKATAYDIVNGYPEEKLYRVIRDYGEEHWARRVAQFICQARLEAPIATTGALVSVIKKAIPRDAREEGQHPAKRTFQAIRIELNQELTILGQALRSMVERLNTGGRICVLTFHSLEDRIVKNTFRDLADPCKCPRDLPVCVCGLRPSVKILTKKPVLPSPAELASNSRARSAKLRVAEKI
jgi:16S rRNA (cytosine1402-N4)-methyltransferase